MNANLPRPQVAPLDFRGLNRPSTARVSTISTGRSSLVNQPISRPATALTARNRDRVSDNIPSSRARVILEDVYASDFVTSSNLDRKILVLQAPPRHVRYRARVVRVSHGQFPWSSCEYRFTTEVGTHVLVAKKILGKGGSYFSISMDSDQSGYLGKLRGNLIGSEFVLYSPGPKVVDSTVDNKETARRELACIAYENRLFRSASKRGPKTITVAVPSIVNPAPYYVNARALATAVKLSGPTLGIDILKNQEARWVPSSRTYLLPFTEPDRIEASAKNFILVSPEGDNILEFAKLSSCEFMLDFGTPISPLAAFAIAISSYDFKLCCE